MNGAWQYLPCSVEGLTLPADADGSEFRLPPGYLEEDDGHSFYRPHWTQQEHHVPPDTWTKGNCLKYSAQEMLARGELADELVRKGEAGEMSQSAVLDALRMLGVKGSTMFTVLSYFKCDSAYATCRNPSYSAYSHYIKLTNL